MNPEVQEALIRKCKQVVEDIYPIDDPIKMADIHDLLLKKGIPFNILYKAYHVQEGRYLFYDKSILLSQLLLMVTMITERAERHPDAKDSVLDNIRKRIDLRCFRVNKDTGYIDVYDYDTGVVLFERRKQK